MSLDLGGVPVSPVLWRRAGHPQVLALWVRPPGLEPRTCGPVNPNELSLLVEADVGEPVG